MPKVSVNDLSFYYESHGEGEDLILISGYSADHSIWAPVVAQLAQHYRVIVFDNRGVGETDEPTQGFSLNTLAQDVVDLMGALKIERAHICGHSMGGRVAPYIALNYPDKVNKLIVLCSQSEPIGFPLNELSKVNAALLSHGVEPELVLRNVMLWLYDEHFFQEQGRYQAELDRQVAGAMKFYPMGIVGQNAALVEFDYTSSLNTLQHSTLVVAGERDLLIRPEITKRLVDRIPNATFQSISHCGHMPPVEQPAALTKLLLDFLK